METSDSECFESADEDFHSDNEDKNIKTAPIFQKNTADKLLELKKLSITDTEITSVSKSKPVQLIEHNNGNSLVDNARAGNRHDRATVKENVNKPEKKEKQPKAKLGVKLGSKIKKSDLNLPISDTIGTSNQDIGDLCSYKDEQVDNLEKESRQVSTNKSNSEKHKRRDSTSDDGWDNDGFEFGHKDNSSSVKQGENNGKVCTLPREEENMWEDDNWEPISDVNSRIDTKLENKNINEKKAALDLKDDDFNSRWMDWGNWGVSTLLNTATVGVTTITSHVSQGFTTVLESGIGVPKPEELARMHTEEKKKTTELDKKNDKNEATPNIGFGLGNFVSGVSQITKLVETTGTKVISGGLDTLETIGKKTMEVLQEGDPGLKKKRAFLKIEPDKSVLSHILREAKEKAEEENKLLEEKRFAKKANYESLFDDHQGLVHLEALEMLSKQCDIKLQTLIESHFGSELVEMQETMSQVNELCELTEEEEEEETVDVAEIKEKLDAAISEMNVPISYDKLISTWTDAEQWLENINLNICDELELHEQAIDTLAQLTAIAVEQFHKIGELLLIKEHRSTADEADSIVQLTTLLTTLLSHVSTKLSNKLHEKTSTSPNKERLNGLITNIYYEAANSSSYIKNAFQLLIPVLQVGAV